MSKTIYKYPLPMTEDPTIEMPRGSRVLTVQVQGSTPCIWAIVDPNQPLEIRRFRVFGTGHPIDENINSITYIGTFQLLGGGFIGHLFE